MNNFNRKGFKNTINYFRLCVVTLTFTSLVLTLQGYDLG